MISWRSPSAVSVTLRTALPRIFFGSGFLIFMRHEPSPAHRTEAKLLSLGRPIPGGANGNRNYPEIDERWTTGLKAFRETANAV